MRTGSELMLEDGLLLYSLVVPDVASESVFETVDTLTGIDNLASTYRN